MNAKRGELFILIWGGDRVRPNETILATFDFDYVSLAPRASSGPAWPSTPACSSGSSDDYNSPNSAGTE